MGHSILRSEIGVQSILNLYKSNDSSFGGGGE